MVPQVEARARETTEREVDLLPSETPNRRALQDLVTRMTAVTQETTTKKMTRTKRRKMGNRT